MTVDVGLAERIEALHATDPQFRAAEPVSGVTVAATRPEARAWRVVQTYLDGYANRPALGQRCREITRHQSGRSTATLLPAFETLTYAQLRGDVESLCAAWQSDPVTGLRAGDFVSVLGFTSLGYAIVYLACVRSGAVFVPLQLGASTRQLQPIVEETAPRIFASSVDALDTAVDVVLQTPSVRRLVVFDYVAEDDDHRDRYASAQARLADADRPITLVPLLTELSSGRESPPVPAFVPAPGEDPLATLIYTSGSTGAPKGAMFGSDMMTRIWQRPRGPATDLARPVPAIHLQYMPLSHVYGLEWLIATLAAGGTGYFTARSDMSTLFDDIALVRPTVLNLVPRICDMIHRRYRSEVASRSPAAGDPDQVAEEVRDALRQDFLGGRVISAMCGSAPLSTRMHEFMEWLLGTVVSDGYGSTETGGGIMRNGIIRRPPVTDYTLVDVPELGYSVTDRPHPRGELYVKSTDLITGYFKHPELTAEIFDADGYYKTGDVMAELAPDHLVYLDRRNNVLKLSQGEFVAVSRLEAVFSESQFVRQIYLYGSSQQPFLLAVVVPNEAAVGSADARTVIAESLQRIAARAELEAYEVPRDFLLETEPFSRDNGLLSGVGKLLRPALRVRYGERLEAMYADMAATQDTSLDELRARSRDLPTVDTVRRAAALTLGLPVDDVAGGDQAFTDLGGDSLSAFSFATTLESVFDVEVSVQTIIAPTATLAGIADYLDGRRGSADTRPTFASVHGRDADVARADDLVLEAFLDPDTLALAPHLPAPAGELRTVLLTGANGYLGRFLLLQWLERVAPTHGTVICLARGADPAAARHRIEAAVDTGDDELCRHFTALADEHLEVFVGDVADEHLGVDAATWQRLCESVDLVVHCAAMVNHVLPYGQLFGPNVVGTAEVIRLAMTTRRKPVDFVSTVAVTALPDGTYVDEDVDVRDASPERSLRAAYAGGYATSKWAGEVLLRRAHDLCGLPVAVFRSDMILAHSRYRGQVNQTDVFTRLMLSVVLTGLAPRSFYELGADGAPQRAHYDGLPADFTAEAITALGAGLATGFHTFNVLNTHDDGISLDTFVDWLIDDGRDIRRVDSYDEWFGAFEAALRALPDEQRAHSVLPLLHAYARPAAPDAGLLLPAARFRAAVQSAGIGADRDVPHLSKPLIDKYLADLRHLGLLPR